jgi:hypothetical protein
MFRQRRIGIERKCRLTPRWSVVTATAFLATAILLLCGAGSVLEAAEPAAQGEPEVSASPSDRPIPQVTTPEPPAVLETPKQEVQKAASESKAPIRDRRCGRLRGQRGHGCLRRG